MFILIHCRLRTAEVIIGTLGVSIFIILVIGIYLIVKYKLLKKSKQNAALSKTPKTFVFTEDVDMGSSFASRMRDQLSQLWARGSSWSYRADAKYKAHQQDLEKGRSSSYGLLTSPRVSLVASGTQTSHGETSKTISWTYFMNEYSELARPPPFDVENQLPNAGPSQDLSKKLSIGTSGTMLAPPAAAHLRVSQPDAPLPAVTLSPSSSKVIFGSGHLSSRTSRFTATLTSPSSTRRSLPSINRFFSTKVKQGSDGERFSFENSFSDVMSSSSAGAMTPSPVANDENGSEDGGIYVSAPIAPANDLDILAAVSESVNDEKIPRRGAGRVPAFPVISQRGLRTSN